MSSFINCIAVASIWRVTRIIRRSKTAATKGVPMFLAFILSRMNRSARFSWSPALNFDDRSVYSTLIPGAQY
ncbi:MAG: hypothetical protein K0Q60_3573 [Microvirga sp.]|jgi:hypothetical protein|nr:hypothetical protein [Microvirga sp.]